MSLITEPHNYIHSHARDVIHINNSEKTWKTDMSYIIIIKYTL